jgi:hypothetical protein
VTSWPDLPLAAARETLPVLSKATGSDWSQLAGETDRSARETLDHTILAVTGYAGLLIAQPTNRYIAMRTGTEPRSSIAECLETLEISATLLSLAVAAASPEARAFHPWGTSDRTGYSCTGAMEILVHGHDIARTFGIDWTLPDYPSDAIVSRLFPNAPSGHAPSRTLLWCTGRIALPGVPRLGPDWQWYGEVRP